MKRTVSLFQFMPYGAPELLAAGRVHLARALAVSSLLPVLAFFALLAVVPMLRTVRLPPVVPSDPRIVDITRPTIIRPRAPEAAVPSVRPNPAEGVLVPVPETDEPLPPVTEKGPPDIPPGPGVRTHDGPAPGPRSGAPAADPTRGIWIYTDELPQAVREFKPEYPDLAREAGVEGLVIVHALIGKDGSVIRAEVDEKRSVPLLDETALSAALKWKFTPALSNGHPVVVWYAIPFKFVLHD